MQGCQSGSGPEDEGSLQNMVINGGENYET